MTALPDFAALVAKATPLPWQQKQSNGVVIAGPQGDALCEMWIRDPHMATARANATLILAAVNSLPALLDRLARLERVAEAADKAHTELAAIGFPQINGQYHKDGRWDFTKADPQSNPADLACIVAAFTHLHVALAALKGTP